MQRRDRERERGMLFFCVCLWCSYYATLHTESKTINQKIIDRNAVAGHSSEHQSHLQTINRIIANISDALRETTRQTQDVVGVWPWLLATRHSPIKKTRGPQSSDSLLKCNNKNEYTLFIFYRKVPEFSLTQINNVIEEGH